MSGIGSVTNSDSNLYQIYAQQVLAANQAAVPDPTSVAATSSTAGSTSSTTTSPLSDLRGQLESAITSALDGLGPSASPGDALESIGNAIQQTLQANGTNPQQLQGTHHGHGHHHHAHSQQAGAAPPSGAGGTTSDPDGDGDSQSSSQDSMPSGATSNTNSTDPLAALVSFGSGNSSDPQNAIASLLGNTDSSNNLLGVFQTLFSNFPNGSGVNVFG